MSSSLVNELRNDMRCGCYADGAGTASRPSVAHHCVTCRAADRIEALEAALQPFADAARALDEHGAFGAAIVVQGPEDIHIDLDIDDFVRAAELVRGA